MDFIMTFWNVSLFFFLIAPPTILLISPTLFCLVPFLPSTALHPHPHITRIPLFPPLPPRAVRQCILNKCPVDGGRLVITLLFCLLRQACFPMCPEWPQTCVPTWWWNYRCEAPSLAKWPHPPKSHSCCLLQHSLTLRKWQVKSMFSYGGVSVDVSSGVWISEGNGSQTMGWNPCRGSQQIPTRIALDYRKTQLFAL